MAGQRHLRCWALKKFTGEIQRTFGHPIAHPRTRPRAPKIAHPRAFSKRTGVRDRVREGALDFGGMRDSAR